MATTALQPTATPGKTRSFSPKTEVPGGSPADQITALSVMGVPGGLREFLAKGVAEAPVDQITDLSVMATPGGLREFLAKTELIIDEISGGGVDDYGPAKPSRREQQLREEDDILIMVALAFVEIML